MREPRLRAAATDLTVGREHALIDSRTMVSLTDGRVSWGLPRRAPGRLSFSDDGMGLAVEVGTGEVGDECRMRALDQLTGRPVSEWIEGRHPYLRPNYRPGSPVPPPRRARCMQSGRVLGQVAGLTLLAGSRGRGQRAVVRALRSNGQTVWERQLARSRPTGRRLLPDLGVIVDRGRDALHLHGVDRSTGAITWERSLPREEPCIGSPAAARSVVTDGEQMLLARSCARVELIDPGSGASVWNLLTDRHVIVEADRGWGSKPSWHVSPPLRGTAPERIGWVSADGQRLTDMPTPCVHCQLAPAFPGLLEFHPGRSVALRGQDGRLIWRCAVEVRGWQVVAGRLLLAGTRGTFILDLTTGTVLSRTVPASYLPTKVGEDLVVLGSDAEIVVVELPARPAT